MKKILNIFFVSLGIIFFFLIMFGIYFFVADPLNLKPLLFTSPSTDVPIVTGSETNTVDKHPMLSDSQEKSLETFGIDPANLPAEITAEQEKCFEDAIGATRVNEIKNGDSPTALEFYQARDCL